MPLSDTDLEYLIYAGKLLSQQVPPLTAEETAWLDTTRRQNERFFTVPANSQAACDAANANPMVKLDFSATPIKEIYAKELLGVIEAGERPLTDDEQGWFAVACGQFDGLRDNPKRPSATQSDVASSAASSSSANISNISLPTDQNALAPTRNAIAHADLQRQWGIERDRSLIAADAPAAAASARLIANPPPPPPSSVVTVTDQTPTPAPRSRNRRGYTRPLTNPCLVVSGGLQEAAVHSSPLDGSMSNPEHKKLQPSVTRYMELEGLLKELEVKLYATIEDGYG
ncbi:hypothetical protein LY78DRAFT_684063 [Colletotrichum sublineola]|nr:hypothetical protein LY78DRAFT_684063 [Colletotrichum sublineola]